MHLCTASSTAAILELILGIPVRLLTWKFILWKRTIVEGNTTWLWVKVFYLKRMLTLLNLRMLQYNCALTVMVFYPVNIGGGKKNRTKMLDLRPTTLKSSRSRMVRFDAEDISTHGVGLQWSHLKIKINSRSNGSPGEAMKETILSSIVAKLSMFLILLVELFDHMPCKYKPLCW